jgi:hypothetical protein
MNKTKLNLHVDIVLTVAFLVALKPFSTGLAIHEWLGLAIGGTLVVHTMLHWRWVVAITRKLFAKAPRTKGCKRAVAGKMRLCYGLDVGLLIAFALIIVTGVSMSGVVLPLLSIPDIFSIINHRLLTYATIADVHKLSSYLTLVLLVVKLVVHRAWIVNAVKRHLIGTSRRKSRSRRGLVGECQPAFVSVTVERRDADGQSYGSRTINRRRFLIVFIGGCAVVTTALVSKFGNQQVSGSVSSGEEVDVWNPTAAATEAPQPTPHVLATEQSLEIEAVQEVAPTEVAPQEVETTQEVPPTEVVPQETETTSDTPSIQPTPTVQQTRCPRGMVNDPYPGQCRRYVDRNGNGYCDLSQPM